MTFTFKPRAGGRIRADIATAADGPHVWLSVTNTRAEHAAVFIPLDRIEEVVAGLRDMARQAGGKCGCGEPTDPGVVHRPALPCHLPEPRRRLTELEHDAAWHAIEGAAGEEGADPDIVLNAVLHALDIDPPAEDEMAASLRRDGFGDDEIAEILARPRTAEGAGA